MRTPQIAFLLATTFGWLMATESAQAQLGFSNRELRVLTAINQANQNQQRLRAAQQQRAIGSLLGAQQQQIQTQQRTTRALQEALIYNDPSLLGGAAIRGTTATSAFFGQVYQGSPYYNRLAPYYDYGFIQSRNRSPALGLSGGNLGLGAPGTNLFGGGGLAPGALNLNF